MDQSKIFLIPHGARDMDPIPDAKKKLNLEGRKIILLAGYFRPTKCFDRIVDLFLQFCYGRGNMVQRAVGSFILDFRSIYC
ncbi:MAG: hypothetical protein LWW97_03560 [Deltaproteobacteria bacterium]|nr:hypothetical protein [Deltaproteobacteria bacterium]